MRVVIPNDVVEEKKVEVVKEKTNKKVEVEKEGSYNWKLISIVALILVAILVIFNIFFLPVVTNEQYVAEEIEDVIEQDITEETEDVILIDSRELFSADAYLARALTNREKSFHSGNSDEDLIFYYQSTINDINNAIKINPNNSSYYFYRAQTYWGYLNHAYRRLNNKLLEKECRQYALSDFSIAIRLYKNTKDKVHISDIYAGRGWLKKEMGVSYCEDFREACKNNPYTGLDNHCNVYNKQCK